MEQVKPNIIAMMISDGTPKKAFFMALIIGTLLTFINHGDFIFKGDIPALWKIVLTYCVPYFVTTFGAVTGKIAEWEKSKNVASLEDEQRK